MLIENFPARQLRGERWCRGFLELSGCVACELSASWQPAEAAEGVGRSLFRAPAARLADRSNGPFRLAHHWSSFGGVIDPVARAMEDRHAAVRIAVHLRPGLGR